MKIFIANIACLVLNKRRGAHKSHRRLWREREWVSEMLRRCCYKINIRLCSHYIKMLNYSVSIKNRSGFPVLSSTNFSKYLCFLVDFQYLFPLIYRVYYAILTRFWLFLSLRSRCAHQQIFSLLSSSYASIGCVFLFRSLRWNPILHFITHTLHHFFFLSFPLFLCQVVKHTHKHCVWVKALIWKLWTVTSIKASNANDVNQFRLNKPSKCIMPTNFEDIFMKKKKTHEERREFLSFGRVYHWSMEACEWMATRQIIELISSETILLIQRLHIFFLNTLMPRVHSTGLSIRMQTKTKCRALCV